jgi:hypothetical protein
LDALLIGLLLQSIFQDIEYHLCSLCYHVFRLESRDLLQCPDCGNDRYEGGNVKKPKKKMYYRPISGFLKRIFAVKSIAQHMSWHAGAGQEYGCVDKHVFPDHPPVLGDVCQGEACRLVQASFPFCNDTRHAMFIVAFDGVNIFKGDNSYSAWPFVITLINLPPWMRRLLPLTNLLTVVPGTREGKISLRCVKEIIADEFGVLGKIGTKVKDASKPLGQQDLIAFADCTHLNSDSRGFEKLLGTKCVPGRHACLQCWQSGHKIGTQGAAGKTIYPWVYK